MSPQPSKIILFFGKSSMSRLMAMRVSEMEPELARRRAFRRRSQGRLADLAVWAASKFS